MLAIEVLMNGGKRFLHAVLRLMGAMINFVAVSLLVFFVALYFTDSLIFTDISTSCVSCKKPGFEMASPFRDVNDDGKITVDEWRIAISPTTTDPKIEPELNPTEQQRVALERVNYYRDFVGLKDITLNEAINKAAQAHAKYNVTHTQSGHEESPGEEGFTGIWPWDRIKFFGYKEFTYATEVASMRWASHDYLLQIDPKWAVDGWVDTVYHRLPIISPRVFEAGFGAGKVEKRLAYVMDFANPGFAEVKRVVHYPVDRQSDVPFEFKGDETPDPLPGKKYPVGYPVTVTFNGYQSIKIISSEVRDSNGVSVPCYRLLPYSDQFIRDSFALIPKEPLERGMVYDVKIEAIADDDPIYLDWSFTTSTSARD
ncbi:MAG: CAP domain-containing protein [Candidatus Aquicultor sp.]|nr:CAP domain-containing protein [Candidatus Aquicultor sp.]